MPVLIPPVCSTFHLARRSPKHFGEPVIRGCLRSPEEGALHDGTRLACLAGIQYSHLHMKVWNATIFPFVFFDHAILDLEVHAERHCVCDALSLSCAAHTDQHHLNDRPLHLAWFV